MLVSPLNDGFIPGVLKSIEFCAQLFNPAQNWKGKFPSMATHFALLLRFEGHPPLVLQRVREGVDMRKVQQCSVHPGQPVFVDGDKHLIVKVFDLSKDLKWEDVLQFINEERQHAYHAMGKNCKHFAYEPRNGKALATAAATFEGAMRHGKLFDASWLLNCLLHRVAEQQRLKAAAKAKAKVRPFQQLGIPCPWISDHVDFHSVTFNDDFDHFDHFNHVDDFDHFDHFNHVDDFDHFDHWSRAFLVFTSEKTKNLRNAKKVTATAARKQSLQQRKAPPSQRSIGESGGKGKKYPKGGRLLRRAD
eukprot:Skav210969  [mRNA]  locus=scaffold2129:120749:132615:+ [translate_table: standard]